jgi:hypothetical protein
MVFVDGIPQIVGRCSDGVEGDDMDHKSLADGYVRMT